MLFLKSKIGEISRGFVVWPPKVLKFSCKVYKRVTQAMVTFRKQMSYSNNQTSQEHATVKRAASKSHSELISTNLRCHEETTFPKTIVFRRFLLYFALCNFLTNEKKNKKLCTQASFEV